MTLLLQMRTEQMDSEQMVHGQLSMEREVAAHIHPVTTTTNSMAAFTLTLPSLSTLCSILWIYLITTQGGACAKVRWNMPESDWDAKKEGITVVLSCEAHRLNNAFSAVSIERGSTDGDAELVVTNQIVEEKFRELMYRGRPRYSARYELLQSDKGFIGTLVLTINAVQSEDAGYYRCKAEGKQTEFRTLAVRVPIEDIYMKMFTPNDSAVSIADGTLVPLKENQRGGIACAVVLRTRFLQPEIKVTAGGRDVTARFTDSSPEEVSSALRPMFTYKFAYLTAKPDADLHGQTVVCDAHAVGYEGQRGRATARLDIEFRPVITCEHYEYFAQLGSSVTMLCAVQANPRAGITFKFGYYLTDNVYNITRSYIQDGQYVFTHTASRYGFSNITFLISPVRRSQFQYSYKLEAANKYGATSTSLLLYEGINGMHVISGGNQVTCWTSHTLLLSLLLLTCILKYTSPFCPGAR